MVHRYPLPVSVHLLHTIWHAAICLYYAITALHLNLNPKDAPHTGPGGAFRYFTSWALSLQFGYFLFAMAFDSLQWTLWFTMAAPVRAVANTGGWPPHTTLVQRWRIHFDRFFFLMACVAGGMGALTHLQWLIECIGHSTCSGLVDDLSLIHARPFWWALVELVLVPHWRDPKYHPPWWVDVSVIIVFMSCWAIHYATFHLITNEYIYGRSWDVTKWLLYFCTIPLYVIVRGLTIIRINVARRCGKKWPYRFGYLLTVHPLSSSASIGSRASTMTSASTATTTRRLSSHIMDYSARDLPRPPPTQPLMASFHDLSGANSSMSRSMASPVDVPNVVAMTPPRSPAIAPLTPNSMSADLYSNGTPSPLQSIPPTAAALLHVSTTSQERSTRLGSMDVPVVYHKHSITDFDSHLLPPPSLRSPPAVAFSATNPSYHHDDDDADESFVDPNDIVDDGHHRRSSSNTSCCRQLVSHHCGPVVVTCVILSSAVITWDVAWLAGVRP